MSNVEGGPTFTQKALSAIKRFSLGAASGGAYPVAKSVEQELRHAQRDEERNAAKHASTSNENS